MENIETSYDFPGIGSIPLNPPPEKHREFISRKLRLGFRAMPGVRDGRIYREDLLKMANAYFDKEKYSPEETARLAKQLVDEGHSPTLLFGKESISEEEYAEIALKKVYASPKERKEHIKLVERACRYSFHPIDTDGNGVIDLDEFIAWFEGQGVVKDEAQAMFKALDANKNGVISMEEFVYGLTCWYMYSGPDSIFSNWFGKVSTE